MKRLVELSKLNTRIAPASSSSSICIPSVRSSQTWSHRLSSSKNDFYPVEISQQQGHFHPHSPTFHKCMEVVDGGDETSSHHTSYSIPDFGNPNASLTFRPFYLSFPLPPSKPSPPWTDCYQVLKEYWRAVGLPFTLYVSVVRVVLCVSMMQKDMQSWLTSALLLTGCHLYNISMSDFDRRKTEGQAVTLQMFKIATITLKSSRERAGGSPCLIINSVYSDFKICLIIQKSQWGN